MGKIARPIPRILGFFAQHAAALKKEIDKNHPLDKTKQMARSLPFWLLTTGKGEQWKSGKSGLGAWPRRSNNISKRIPKRLTHWKESPRGGCRVSAYDQNWQ